MIATSPQLGPMPDSEDRNRPWGDRSAWDAPRSDSLDRTLGRMESKLDSVDRSFSEFRQLMQDRSSQDKVEINNRFREIDAKKADAADVELLKRIVFGAVAVILIAFVGGLAVVRFSLPGQVPPPAAGARP